MQEVNPFVQTTIIRSLLLEQKGIELQLLRLDQIQGPVNGNKWYKLKYNIEAFRSSGKKFLVSFGGAFSNHLAALAASGEQHGIPTVGVIRGEEHFPRNPTLELAFKQGMELQYIDRITYRDKPKLMAWAEKEFGNDAYFLPEGGSNQLAVKGCSEILDGLNYNPDVVCCSCGTGATLAGIALSEKGRGKTMGFPALKDISFFEDALRCFAGDAVATETRISGDYHFGGYAKTPPELIRMVDEFSVLYQVQLDYIYTGKMMYGILDLVRKDHFQKGARLLAIHTGGVQGNTGIHRLGKQG